MYTKVYDEKGSFMGYVKDREINITKVKNINLFEDTGYKEYYYSLMRNYISEVADGAWQKGQLVSIPETISLRGIGKTEALIELAMRINRDTNKNIWLVVSNGAVARHLRMKYNFSKIVGQTELSIVFIENIDGVIVDETVDIKNVEGCKLDIVCGFINKQ